MNPANENVSPWARFFARWIDMSAYGVLVVFSLTIVLPFFLPSAWGLLKALSEIPVVINIILIFPWVIVETILLATWGTTPGKKLLKVEITNADGSGLSLRQAFRRSLSVFAKGYGMGIPLLAASEYLWCHYSLTNYGTTSWDRIGGFEVRHGEIGITRKALAGGIVALISICFFLLATSFGG